MDNQNDIAIMRISAAKANIFYILLSCFLLIIPVQGSWSLFGHNPKDCDPTQPKKPKSDGDSYSISSQGYPLRNGKEYAGSSSGYMAGEIFNITLAQNYSLTNAYSMCRNAMTSDYNSAMRYGGNPVSIADAYKNNLAKCDTLFRNYTNSPSVVNTLRKNKQYQSKSSQKADGYYEICYNNGFTYEIFTYKNNSRDGLFAS